MNTLQYMHKSKDTKLKVAFFMTTILEHGGGFELYLIKTAAYISRNFNCTIDIITMDEEYTRRLMIPMRLYYFRAPSREIKFNIPTASILEQLESVNYLQVSNIAELRSKLTQYDVIYTKNEILEAFILKFFVGFKKMPPVIFGCHTTLHYPNPKSVQSRIHNLLYSGAVYKYLASRVSAFHVLNTGDEETVRKMFPSKNIQKIPNAIDVASLNNNAKKFILDHQFAIDKINIAWVGRLTEQKGIDDLVALIKSVNASYKENVVWNIAGDGPERQKILDLVAVSTNVSFFGHIESKYVPNFLQHMDLFVSTSKWEGHPLNILEAQAMGLVCFCYKIPGTDGLVNAGSDGEVAANITEMQKYIELAVSGKLSTYSPPASLSVEQGLQSTNARLFELLNSYVNKK